MKNLLEKVTLFFGHLKQSPKKLLIVIVVAILLIPLYFVGNYYLNNNTMSDYSEITILVNNKQYRVAEQRLQSFLTDNAQDPYFLILEARVYIGLAGESIDPKTKSEYLLQAIGILSNATSIKSDIPEIYTFKALAYLGLGEIDFAETFYKKALQFDLNSPVILNELARLYLLQGRINLAVDTLTAIFDTDPNNEGATITFAKLLFAQGRFEQALQRVLVVNNNTTNSDTKSQSVELLGQIYFKLSQYDDAKSSYEKALELNPHSIIAQYGLAEASYAKSFDIKNITQSLEESRQLSLGAVSLDPSYPYSYILLARIASNSNNEAEYTKYINLTTQAIDAYPLLSSKQKQDLKNSLPKSKGYLNENVKIKVISAKATTTSFRPGIFLRK